MRDEVVDRLVVLQPLGYDLDNLRLLDEAGQDGALRDRRAAGSWNGSGASTTGAELFCDDQLDLLDTYLHRFGDRIIGTEADARHQGLFPAHPFPGADLPAVGHVQYRLVDDAAGPSAGSGFRPGHCARWPANQPSWRTST